MSSYKRVVYPLLRQFTACLCVYEAVQIWRHGATLSRLAEKYPWLGPLLIAALTVHIILIGNQDPSSLTGDLEE